jgi:hypothetical protein
MEKPSSKLLKVLGRRAMLSMTGKAAIGLFACVIMFFVTLKRRSDHERILNQTDPKIAWLETTIFNPLVALDFLQGIEYMREYCTDSANILPYLSRMRECIIDGVDVNLISIEEANRINPEYSTRTCKECTLYYVRNYKSEAFILVVQKEKLDKYLSKANDF